MRLFKLSVRQIQMPNKSKPSVFKHYSKIIYSSGKSNLMVWKVFLSVPLYAEVLKTEKDKTLYVQSRVFLPGSKPKINLSFHQLKRHLLLKNECF